MNKITNKTISKAINDIRNISIKECIFHNQNWFVLLSFIIACTSLGLTIYAIFWPIQDIQSQIADIKYDFPKVFNEQTIDTSKMSGKELITIYYELINSGAYQTACTLISTQQCTMYDVQKFTEWVDGKKRYYTIKLKDGETLEKVWFSGEKLQNTNSEIWCAETSFYMNNENDPIKQIWQYTIAVRPDNHKEIRKFLCEYAVKNSQDRTYAMGCNTEPKTCLNTQSIK